jgi:hypothetical protein
MGLRVSDEAEIEGLDLSQHEESAYVFGAGVTRGWATLGAGAASPQTESQGQTRPAGESPGGER